MKLYHFPPSPNTRRVLAVVHHLGLETELEMTNILESAQMTPEYLSINPNHRTPALVDGDFKLWESNAIMQYLADTPSGSELWPADRQARADISRWQCWQLAHFGPACGTFIFENVVKKLIGAGDADPAAIEKATGEFHEFAKVLDQHLQGRDWLVGDKVTLADYSVAAPLGYAEAVQMPINDYAEVKRWYGNVDQLPAWQKSAPPPLPQ